MKRVLRRILSSRPVSRLSGPLTTGKVSIFTLHRFADTSSRTRGHDLTKLEQTLERLRDHRYQFLSLPQVLEILSDPSKPINRSVAFTVDDGYADFLTAADVFLAYDCPVTVFVCTGFIDGALWHWWDQIEFICFSTEEPAIEVTIGGAHVVVELGDPSRRLQATRLLWERSKAVSEGEKIEAVSQIGSTAGVSVPAKAPERYAAMTWGQIRTLENRGIRFGPHTVSHPILARTSERDSYNEIERSWSALQEKLQEPVPIFAYPNGLEGDYGPREFEALRRCGLQAALTMNQQYATQESLGQSRDARYELPRFAYPEDPDRAHLIASGFSRITHFLRRHPRQGMTRP